MVSNHLHNGIQTAKIVWSRVPSSEEGEPAEVEFASRSHGGTGAESLDYEVIENYAYRKEQVEFALGAGRKTLCFVLCGPQMVVLFSYWHRYALLGAASFLGGPMRMTVSLCVIMVEITNNLKLLPLIMLVLLISKVIEDHEQNGEALVIGLILCRTVLFLVICGEYPISNRQNFSGFVKTVSGKGMSTEDIHLTEDELELYLDLASYLNPAPYIVPEDMSLAKVYNLFRQLGLRHIFVVPCPSHHIGLVTRKDLLIEESDPFSNHGTFIN